MEPLAILPSANALAEQRNRQDMIEGRLIGDASKARSRTRRRTRDRVLLVDHVLVARSRDIDASLWTLEAHHAGDVSLLLDGEEIAFISHKQGAPLLAMDACPYIRAADVLTSLITGLAVDVSTRVCAELEVALARWIPLYFEL